MPYKNSDGPSPLKELANFTFVIYFLRLTRSFLGELFTEEVEFHSFGQSPFLGKMSRQLRDLVRKSREHKDVPLNTDRSLTDIVDYVDECLQRAEMGYFFRSEFIEQIEFLLTRARALLDLQ